MFIGTITGRIGQAPETRTAGSGTITKVSVVADHGFGDRKTSTWVEAEVWGKQGERMAAMFGKGGTITLTGQVVNEEYNGKRYLKLKDASWGFVPGASSGNDTSNEDGGKGYGQGGF